MTTGFGDARGLLTISDYEKLEEMRSQPSDVQVNERTEFMDLQGFDGDIVPASAWMEWNIYQPTRYYLIDFSDNNGHQDLDSGTNGKAGIENYTADDSVYSTGFFIITDDYWPDDNDFKTVPVDATCATRASEVLIDGGDSTSGMIQSSLVITQRDSGKVVIDTDCNTGELGICLLYTSDAADDL